MYALLGRLINEVLLRKFFPHERSIHIMCRGSLTLGVFINIFILTGTPRLWLVEIQIAIAVGINPTGMNDGNRALGTTTMALQILILVAFLDHLH
jgi:hypothetical protein